MSELRSLLKLQQLDTAIDVLRHKAAETPAHATVKQIEQRAVSLRTELSTTTATHNEIASRQSVLESEIEAIESRTATINLRLYDGSAKIAADDALAMSAEIKQLNERRSSLEDDELACMEELEPVAAQVSTLEQEAHKLAADLAKARQQLIQEQSELEEAIQSLGPEKAELMGQIDSTLLKKYEMLRGKMGGVAVAPFTNGACGGCHLALAPTEIARIKNAGENEVIYCDECGRILVR